MATPEAIALAAELLRQKEGLRSNPYWDVNALRAGYGSDTVTRPDGSVQKVTKDTVVTKEDAERDLARRVAEFAGIAQKEIGANFSNLTPQAQAAITSVAYNYGTTKKVDGLVKAAQTGDNNAIAKAIAGAANHNGGVNKQRRLDEAAIVLGKKPLTANPISVDTVAGFNGAANIPNPQSQLGDVKSYNSQMVQAAQKIADNNLAAVNNFNWNPNTKDSSAQRFGKTVSANTDALSQVYDTNMKEMQAFTNPTADTYLGRVGDRLGAIWNVSGNTLTERYLKRAEASQSGTGKAMAEQVANMKSVLDGTVINPAFLDKAASNLTQQQQVENQTYNVVTDNANTQQQLKQQMDIANMQNETEQAKIAIARQKANGVVDNPDDSSLVNAARSLGIQLPEGMKTSDIKATLGDKLAAVQVVAANNGSLGSDPYTAVQTVKLLGNAAPPELVRQAQIHENFQASVLASKGYKEIPVPLGASKEQAAMISAQNDNAKRVIINKAYQEAANNEGGLATLPGNPYSSIGGDTKTLANGLPVPKGIAPEEVGKLSAVDFISKASAAGASSVEIANFYKGLNTNATKDTNFKVFNAPAPSGKFVVQLKGVDDKMDLATPAGVERFKALIKSNQVKLDSTNAFFKFLSAGVDFFDPQAYISGNKTGQFGYNNNLVDQLTGTPQVTLNPK